MLMKMQLQILASLKRERMMSESAADEARYIAKIPDRLILASVSRAEKAKALRLTMHQSH